MNSTVVCDGDSVIFLPTFGPRQVFPEGPVYITGSGSAMISQRKIAVVGDEKKIRCPAQYILPGYRPGRGVISIVQLDSSQIAPLVSAHKLIIKVGHCFYAQFQPTEPAIMIAMPNTPDNLTPGFGRGYFLAMQKIVSAG